MRLAGGHHRVRWLTLLYALNAGALLAALLLDGLAPVHGPVHRGALAALLAIAFLALLLTGVRLYRFRTRMRALLRRLVSGDYESGMQVCDFCADEVVEIEELVNRLVEQLRRYDDLRTERIRQLRMTLNMVLEHTSEPMILFDVEKGALDFNPAMARLLGLSRQSAPLDTLRNLDTDEAFCELLTRATAEEKSAQEGTVEVRLPEQASPRELDLRVLPYKDKNEDVPFAIVFGKPAS